MTEEIRSHENADLAFDQTAEKIFRKPATMPVPLGSYNHSIEVAARQRWLVMAGQVGQNVDGSVPEDPIEQVTLALENVRLNLEAAAMGVGDLVKLTWYLVGEIDTLRRRAVTAEWLAGHEPASTVVYVAALAAPIYRVEIDAWACSGVTL
jgi:enamine deaminase RidA (YjgF/YER057c/UK114 family)